MSRVLLFTDIEGPPRDDLINFLLEEDGLDDVPAETTLPRAALCIAKLVCSATWELTLKEKKSVFVEIRYQCISPRKHHVNPSYGQVVLQKQHRTDPRNGLASHPHHAKSY